MSQDASAADALGFALTGAWLDLSPDPAAGFPDPVSGADGLLALLAAAGWTRDRIADHASAEQTAERAWPHHIPHDRRGGLGAAQIHAALASARTALGLDGTLATRPSGRTRLNADERRLLADVPPHSVAR